MGRSPTPNPAPVPGAGNRRAPDVVCILLLLALACLFFWPALIGQRVLLPLDDLLLQYPWGPVGGAVAPGFTTPHNGLILDMIIQNYGWKRFLVSQLASGTIPLWNPYLLGGTPFLASGQYQVLYPLNVLFLVLPVAWAYGPYTVLHIFLGALFTFLYLRLIGEQRAGALVSAITFAFCGSVITSVLWPQMIGAMAWLPAVLLSIELVARAKTATSAAGAAALGVVAIAMQILAGHLEISFYVLFTGAGYALWRLVGLFWQRETRPLALRQTGLLLVMGLAGTGLAGAQLLPFAEAISNNFREGAATLADVRGWALPIRQLLTFVIPDFFGNPTQHTYLDLFTGTTQALGTNAAGQPSYPPQTAFWGIKNYVEAASYTGISPLVLAAIGLLGRRHRYASFFAVAAVLSLLLAFGTPLYAILFQVVPGFSQIHTAFRWVFIYSFSVAVLAGMGAGWLLEQAQRSDRQRLILAARLLALAVSALAMLVIAATWLLRGRLADLLQRRIAAEMALPRSQWNVAAQLHDGQQWFSYLWPHAAWAAAMLAAAGAAIWLALGRRTRRAALVALPLVVALDLFVVNGSFNTMSDPRLLTLIPASTAVTAPAAPDEPPATVLLRSLAAKQPPFRIAAYGPDGVLNPNSAMLYDLQDVRGYDTIVLRRYADFLNLIEPQLGNLNLYSQTTSSFNKPATLSNGLFDLLGVRYILTTKPLDNPLYTRLLAGPVQVYENSGVLPRAFMVYRATAVPNTASALTAVGAAGFQPAVEAVVEGPASLTLSGSATGSTVTISRYQSSTVQLDVTTPSAGYLVLADTYFPGWTARYQAAGSTTSWTSVPVLPADEAFRAIELPAGHWTVEFRYQPLAFREGLVASSLSLGVLLLLAAGWLWGTLNRTLDLQTNAAQRIAKNAISPMLSTLSNKVLDFGFNIFTAVIIGPDGIGRFAEAVSLVLLAGTVQDYGLGSATIRDVARDRSLATRYFTNTLLLRLALAVASLPVLAPIVWLGHLVGAYDALTIWTLVFLVAGFFPGSIASAAASVLRAVERFEAPAFVEVAGNLLRILLGSVALLAGWNVVGLAVTSLIVNVFNAVALGWAARGVVQLRLGPLDRPLCGFLLRDSFSLMLNNLLNLVFFRVDTVLLTFLVRDTAIVGYYSVAYKFIDGLGFVSSYLTFAIFPTLSRLATAPGDLFRRVYLFAVRVLIVTALPIMAVMGILGTRIVTLFYPDFAPAGPALSILVLFLVFSYVNGVTQYALIARGQQRIITGAFVVGVTFNIVANLAAIPLVGINGAALITVLSELVLAVPFFRGLWPAITPFPALLLIVRPLLAALGATAVTVILRDANWLIVLPAAALTYAILLVVLRALTTTDWRHMRQLFAQRSFSEAQLP